MNPALYLLLLFDGDGEVPGVPGPFRSVAGQAYSPGTEASDSYSPGTEAGYSYSPGSEAGEAL